MRSFWEEKGYVVVENINNENIAYKVKPERDTDGRIRVLHRNTLLPCDDLLDNFNWNIKTKPTHKKQNKKTASGLLPKKSDNEEVKVTRNKNDGSEMGEMIAFTPREIQIFSRENSESIEKEEKEDQKVEGKVDFSIELENSRQEMHKEKAVRSKGNEKIIVVNDGFEYCEIGGGKMDNKDQSGTKGSNEKTLRIKKMITVEDDSVICEKGWKQTAMCDPDNTRQTSNTSPPRRIKDSLCITDPEQKKGRRKTFHHCFTIVILVISITLNIS